MSRVDRPLPRLASLRRTIAVVLLAALVVGCSAAATPAAFSVRDLTVGTGSQDIVPGDAVPVSAIVENTGGTAGTYAADLTLDGSVHLLQDVDVPAGESATVRFEVRPEMPGDHTVRLEDEVATVRVAAVAAFRVSDLVMDGGPEIVTGDEVTIMATVENAGGAAGTYQAELTLDGSVIERQGVALTPGQSTVLTFRLPTDQGVPALAAGDHEVRLGDSTLALRVLAPAAFAVSALQVTPNPVETGDPLEVAVTVANTGGVTGMHPVKLLMDGKLADTQEATIEGGDRTTVVFTIDAPKAGRHTIAIADLETELVVHKITRPANGKVLVNKLKGGMGRLTVKNGDDRDAVVVLAKSSKPSKALLAVYVRGDKSTTVKGLKDGTYVVYFRFGERWDSHTRAFTTSQSQGRFEDTMRFKTTRTSTQVKYTIVTISLHQANGGSSPTNPVEDDDFPTVP